MWRLMLKVLLCLISSVGLSYGANLSAEESHTGSWEITIENDSWGSNTDQHYTHGTRLTRRSHYLPDWLRRTAGWFPCIACSNPSSVEYEFGQEIFTPENTAGIELIENDRPYAGWAYAKTTLSAVRPIANSNRELFDAIGFQLGVVGPASFARQTQSFVHKRTGVTMPQGWDNQLGHEIGVVLTYTRGMRRRFGQVSGGAIGHDLALRCWRRWQRAHSYGCRRQVALWRWLGKRTSIHRYGLAFIHRDRDARSGLEYISRWQHPVRQPQCAKAPAGWSSRCRIRIRGNAFWPEDHQSSPE